MSEIEVIWHAQARARVAPHTKADLEGVRGYWHLKGWEDITKIFSNLMEKLNGADDELRDAAKRVAAWKTVPTAVDSLDLEAFIALLNVERVGEFAAKRFGLAAVAPVLARPSMTSSWTSGSYMLSRTKLPPHTKTLRMALVAANAEERAAAKNAILPIWDEGDVALRQHLAHAFFFEEAWRAQALAEVLDQAPTFESMQLTLARDEESLRKLLARRDKAHAVEYPEIVASLGAGALPVLLELAHLVRGNDAHLSHALATSVLVGEAPAKHLASCLSHPSTRSVIGDYFSRHPALAQKALPAAAAGASRNAALAKALLLKIVGTKATEADEPLVGLDDPAVPQILRDAPWLDPKPALPDLGVDPTAWPSSVTLSEARTKAGLDWIGRQHGTAPEMTVQELALFQSEHGKTTLYTVVHEGKGIPLETVLARFNAGTATDAFVLPMLAKFGARAIPGVLPKVQSFSWLGMDVLEGIDDPRIAWPLLDKTGNASWAWFLAHPRSAIVGLLAVAHKEPLAAIAVRRLAREGHEKVVLEIAETTKHPDAVRALLARDPRRDVVRVAKQTTTHACSRPRLRDGRPLGDDVIQRILEMLSMLRGDETYAGIDDVKRACEPHSLAEMAWDLAALADGAGIRRQQAKFPNWMRWSLRHFADDEVIRRMTPALKHDTIYLVLESFSRDGERAALIELATAEERESVTGALARVAAAKDVAADELVETMLPTTQLDAEGATTLAYGQTTLRVGFDTTLTPFLFAGDKRLASLPRAKASDDALAVRLAKEHWEELKEDVRTIAHLRVHALENAMRSARRIPAAQFVEAWATHPLGKHQARGVVWAVDGSAKRDVANGERERGEALVTFRVAEDSTFADIDDHALVLAPHDFVRVPHPAELAPDLVNRWSTILGDYGLIQPAIQLARTPLPIAPGDLAKTELVHDLAQPVEYNAYRRVAREQRHYGARPLARQTGEATIDCKTKWENRATWITQVSLRFTIDRQRARSRASTPSSSPSRSSSCVY